MVLSMITLLLAGTSHGDYQSARNVNSSCDGLWSTPACWSPVGVPGPADTWTILAGDTITITDTRAIGAGTVGTTAAGKRATLILGGGAALTMTGKLSLASADNQQSLLRLEAGSRLDLGTSTLALGTAYSAKSGFWRFETLGTPAARVTVTGAGKIDYGNVSARGSVGWSYTTFEGLGGGINSIGLHYSSTISHNLFKLAAALNIGHAGAALATDQDLIFTDNDFRQASDVTIYTDPDAPLVGRLREFSGNTFYSAGVVPTFKIAGRSLSGGYLAGSGNHFYNWLVQESNAGNNTLKEGSFYQSARAPSGSSYLLLGSGGSRFDGNIFFSEGPNNHGINGGRGILDSARHEITGNIFDNTFNIDTANTIIPGQRTGTLVAGNLFFVNGMEAVTYGLNGYAQETSNAVHDLERNTFILTGGTPVHALYWEGIAGRDQAGLLNVRNNIFRHDRGGTDFVSQGNLDLPDWLDYIDGNVIHAGQGTLNSYSKVLIATYAFETVAPTYLNATMFTLSGNLTARYPANQVVKIYNGPYHGVTRVTAVTYDAGTDTTTVTIGNQLLTSALSAVSYQTGQKSVGSPGFGSRDVQLAVDPQFVDPTRTIASYTGSAKEAFFRAMITRNGHDENGNAVAPSSWSVAGLLKYLRDGFTPRNAALKGTGEGGVDIGAVPVSTPNRVNVALSTNGGVAAASSAGAAFVPANINNGSRNPAGGYWRDTTYNVWPDSVMVTFNGRKEISEIDVITAQNDPAGARDPIAGVTTFTANGITDYVVQYCADLTATYTTTCPVSGAGTRWVTTPNGNVIGNNLVWRTLTFPAVTTNRIRVVVNGAKAGNSYITEIEAYTSASLPGTVAGTARVSAGSGTWAKAFPAWVDGDTATIANGHTVVLDMNVTAGSNAAGVGAGITINGSSPSVYGRLIVADGVTLTLRGHGTTVDQAMLIKRHGVFEPLAGATIVVDPASDYQTVILNNGVINAIGTQAKPITWRIPDSRYTWNNAISGTAKLDYHKYDPITNRHTHFMGQGWISNAAGTGIGRMGDSSLLFADRAESGAMTHETASPELVLYTGDYYVNYQIGWICYYSTVSTAPGMTLFTWTALNMSRYGWGIVSEGNTDYNEFKAEYNMYYALGGSRGADNGIRLAGHQAASKGSNRLLKITHSAFYYSRQALRLKNINGTDSDYIDLTHNTFVGAQQSVTGGTLYPVEFYLSPSSYVDFSYLTNFSQLFAHHSVYGAAGQDLTGIRFNNVSGVMMSLFHGAGPQAWTPGLEIRNCDLSGMGSAANVNLLDNLAGAPGKPVVISGNIFRKFFRTANVARYVTLSDNLIERPFHHGIYSVNGSAVNAYVVGIIIKNNLFVGDGGFDNPPTHTGYNTVSWWDDFEISQNSYSIGKSNAAFCFGDSGDSGYSAVPIYGLYTRGKVHSNLSYRGGFCRAVDQSAYEKHRMHVSVYDYNLDYDPVTSVSGGTALAQGSVMSGASFYNTMTSGRSLSGVSLFQSSHTGLTNKSLAYGADTRSLSWDNGPAVSIFREAGVLTADGANDTTAFYPGYATATDAGKKWDTTGSSNSPVLTWLKITSGVALGEVRAVLRNSATVLTVAPAWTPGKIPAVGDTYELWETEVVLTAADGKTIHAGVYLPEWSATTSVSDHGLSFVDHHLAVDPDLVNPTGLSRSDMTPRNNALRGAGYEGVDIGVW